MRRRLHVGILSLQPGWVLLLKQLGLPFERVNSPGSIDPAGYSVVVVNRYLNREEADDLEKYISNGGGVIDTGFFLRKRETGGFTRRYRRSIVPDQHDPLLRGVGPIDLFSRVRAYHDSAESEAGHLDGLLHLTHLGKGCIAYVGFDVDRLLTDTRNARKQFHGPGKHLPDEVTARVSKGEIREIVERLICWLHAERGIPYVRAWRFPGKSPSVFCYRIDSDYGTADQIDGLYETAHRNGISMSWFLHVEAHREWLSRFRNFQDQEIGVHCYRHKTFRSYDANYGNIAEARSLLADIGLSCVGFAAPNGFWNVELARAVEDLGFGYASEFSLDYDDLPFFPWLRHRFSDVLQVPVHPVCIGSLVRAKASTDQMKEYFRSTARMKLGRNEPVIFYHHPGHEHYDVMDDTFAYIRELGIPNMTMGDYARWWNGRSRAVRTIWYEERTLSVTSTGDDPSVRLCADLPDGRRGFIEPNGDFREEEIAWQMPAPQTEKLPNDLHIARGPSLRLIQHSIEDFNSRMRQ